MTITNESPGYLPVDLGTKPFPEGLFSQNLKLTQALAPFMSSFCMCSQGYKEVLKIIGSV